MRRIYAGNWTERTFLHDYPGYGEPDELVWSRQPITFAEMAVPRCPNPTHSKARVVRAGWHGSAPHRRQRWLCSPPNGDPAHRFTEVLPRQQAAASHCSECSSVLDPWEGQAGAREYAFSARTSPMRSHWWRTAAATAERQRQRASPRDAPTAA